MGVVCSLIFLFPGLIGNVGTAPVLSVMDYAVEHQIPLIGSKTGARALRHPYQRHIVNVRASYDDEITGLTPLSTFSSKENKLVNKASKPQMNGAGGKVFEERGGMCTNA